MDSLKIPTKGKATGSLPMAIRFTASDETVEDVTKTSESLSSSPQQNDDSNWRKEFLQGTFFNRKRSGSIEGAIAIVPPQNGNSNTWKIIKGKVSQAMEDIKSSKSDFPQASKNADESDIESGPVNSSMSDDLSDKIILNSCEKASTDNSDSDNDIDFDIPVDAIKSPSILKASLDRIKNSSRKKTGVITNNSSNSIDANPSKIKSFLKRRQKSPVKTLQREKNVEIESGVEMMEDMILINGHEHKSSAPSDQVKSESSAAGDSKTELLNEECASLKKLNKQLTVDNNMIPSNESKSNNKLQPKTLQENILSFYENRALIFGIFSILVVYFFNIPQFLQGVLSCLFCFILFSNLYEAFISVVNKYLLNGERHEKNHAFLIPDYNKMPICEIPAAEEHKELKTYSGWMNEINNYDPSNFHISMTRTIFLKLDGCNLRISNSNSRVPKRSMWNETPIEKKNIVFTQHRNYNLRDCRVEMCPTGLARKRHFSRKYPILLTIKNQSTSNDSATNSESKSSSEKNEPLDRNDSSSFELDSSIDATAADLDIGTTIMNSDVNALQKLHENQENIQINDQVPCGDETRILLFARNDREKEDWYRRFKSASLGVVSSADCSINSFVTITDEEVAQALKHSILNESDIEIVEKEKNEDGVTKAVKSDEPQEDKKEVRPSLGFEGLLMTACASRGPADYLRFMSHFQKHACFDIKIPDKKHESQSKSTSPAPKKSPREKKNEDSELWKGIDQSMFLGPSSNIVWTNVLLGRILYGCVNDPSILKGIQDFLEKKLTAIRLPSFMEDVHVAEIFLGETPPIIHRISQPLMDERGIWIDADVTYEGLMHMTITTKMNLLRLKKQEQRDSGECTVTLPTQLAMKVLCDSDAESSGASSSESESSIQTNPESSVESQSFYSPPGNSRKILRIVDRITASNLFQSATEISYIQRAMENMSTNIKLRVELKGLVARVIINIPPPPSDRLWIGFRGPPRLWLTAKPAVGDHSFDWSLVTNVIENKLCDEVYKYLVYPNMVDIILPFLGQPTYQAKEV